MLVEHLLQAARRFPNKPAANDPTRRLTYAQLTTLARVIRRLVLKQTRCSRLGMMLPGSAGGLGTILGSLWAGKTIVPLSFLMPPRELAAVVADARIDLVITTRYFKSLVTGLPVRCLYLERLNLKRRFLWEKLRPTPEPPAVSPEDLAAIVYTSGTTGEPKGVCLTYRNLLSNSTAAIEHMRLAPEHHLLGIIPPFHAFGLTVLNFIPIVLGATITYIPRFSPPETCRAIMTRDISLVIAVPSMYAAIARLKSLDRSKFQHVRLAVSGGEPLPRTVYDRMYERTGLRLMEGYGMTETSPVISCDMPWSHRVGTVGSPLPGVQTQVRNEAGQPIKPGQTDGPGRQGELFVRGPLVMKGYFHRAAETAAVIDADGWFRTGDIVRIDGDGRISITGRAKDLIIVGGENVFPREVESVLESHPAVADAAVIGREDGSRGEVVVGFVTLHDGAAATADKLRSFCRNQLAGYKVPRQIHIHPDLPRGPTGKIVKRQLKSLLAS